MDELELLEKLSEVQGIVPEYLDNWQRRHRPSASTQRALLSAMGIDVASKEQLVAALEASQLRPWRNMLKPVQVSREAPVHIRLVLKQAQEAQQFDWRLVLEDGSEQSDSFCPSQWPRLEERELDAERYIAWQLVLPAIPPIGYHQFMILSAGAVLAQQSLIVVPAQCYQPEALTRGGRVWGPAVQLYALRSERNWGIGDFTDLRLVLEQWSAWGADIVGVNPLHVLFPTNPEQASPYSPSSRLFLNQLYLDVEAIADFNESAAAQTLVKSAEFQLHLEQLRETELVDYNAVAANKLPLLDLLYQHFREHHLSHETERATEFRVFQQQAGEVLYYHALFEALQEYFHQQDPLVWGWPLWPEAYRQPHAAAVAEFAKQQQPRIEFFSYLQWQANLQLAAVGQRSLELGLGVGIYLDLAVSVNAGGAEAWINQHGYALGVGLGAPPETNNQLGQDWGLPPLVPEQLVAAAYAPFIATLRHNMRHAGALRLDHVMGLMRQYWIPAGTPPSEGAYVQYPFDDLLGILALESQRNQCLVIGEDLGTVPDEVRAALAPLGVLSYRVLIDAKDADGSIVPPAQYPTQALATFSTHDMPTLAGFWAGQDLLCRTELNLFASQEARRTQVINRARERAELLLLLEQDDLLPEGLTVNPLSLPVMTPVFATALQTELARSPATVFMIQLEDVYGMAEQVNIPATIDQHPNWRRKLPLNLESCASDPRPLAISSALQRERPRRAPRPAPRRARIPRATYRLQFNRDFTFAQATKLLPYLAQLGVSHVYCSPYLMARAGSRHGYDIIDHTRLNPEIGTAEDFAAFCAELQRLEMSQILDMVPNHMGVMGADNEWWLDVLEHGQASIYAAFFDIDWQPNKRELRDKLLLPILGQRYGSVLEAAELKLVYDGASGSFSVWYGPHRLPIDPAVYPRLLQQRYDRVAMLLGPDSPELQELASLNTAFEHLPSRQAITREEMLERRRDGTLLKRRLQMLTADCAEIAAMVRDTVTDFNGVPGDPASFQPLHALLETQVWRLADWHVAFDEINYRRFFDINELAALRMEDPRVFEVTHQLILKLIAEGQVAGLRIDHPDGLYDPAQYFKRLHERATSTQAEGSRRAYLVVEKILARAEPLRSDWVVHGSTGYDFCNLLTRLFVDPAGEQALDRAYRQFINQQLDFRHLVYDAKRFIMEHIMASEVNVLTGQLSRICESSPHTRDYTFNSLRSALVEIIAHFPVYRTYVQAQQVTSLDRRYVEWAVALAKKGYRGQDTTLFDFISSVLLLDASVGKEECDQLAVTALAMKFQQVSSPVMAKGLEDTALYLYHRLISLNEVGGDPTHFSLSVEEFHSENRKRLEQWPHAMLTTSTHDSKRSEQVRMRINVLSEIPALWHQQTKRWKQLNRHRKRRVGQNPAPFSNDEYLLYQTLLGSWPLQPMTATEADAYRLRIEDYMLKAIREGKQNTSWINPVPAYEEALCDFIRLLLQPGEDNLFLAEFLPLQQKVARWGLFNAFSQLLLKLTAPGVPDIFQGNELWHFCLVDPDNRRPVGYALRQQLLTELEHHLAVPQSELAQRVTQLVDELTDSRALLYLAKQTLAVRKRWPGVFQEGDYQALSVTGAKAEHLCVFARRARNTTLITVAPRWYSRLAPDPKDLPLGHQVWQDTIIELPDSVPGRTGTNTLTGEVVPVLEQQQGRGLLVSTVLGAFPVALLQF